MPNEASDQTPSDDAQRQSPTQTSGVSTPQQGTMTDIGAANPSQTDDSTKQLANEIHWIYHATFWLQVGLGVVGIAALVIYYGQLRTMNRTYSEMARQYPELQKSADAAKKSADTAENSFRVERRRAEDMEEAICTVNGGGGAAFDNSYQVSIVNSGRVTAREIKTYVELSLNTVPGNKRVRVLANTDMSVPELGRDKDFTQKLKLPLSSEDWRNIADTKQIIEQTATFTYENGFERKISNNRCNIWLYYRTPQDKLNPVQGRGFDCSRLSEQLATVPKP